MIRKLAFTTVFVVVALAGLIHVGCTGSDVVTLPIGNLTVNIESTNQGMSRFEEATTHLYQVYLRPVDPAADANLGVNDLGVFPVRGTPIDLNSTDISPFTISLTAGTYRFTRITHQSVKLVDYNPPASPETCMENFDEIPTEIFSSVFGMESKLFDVTYDPDDATTFTVSGDDSTVHLIVDSQVIIDAWIDSFACRTTRNCVAYGNPPPPCLNGFRENDYQDQLVDAVYFAQ